MIRRQKKTLSRQRWRNRNRKGVASRSQPYVVGLHWCAFIENRTRKSGLKNYLDEPYEDCVSRMQEFNRKRLYGTALSTEKATESKP